MSNTNGPILEGQPSPSLKRMQRLSPARLRHRLERLEHEVNALERRLRHPEHARDAAGQVTPPVERIRRVADELTRLRALIEAGRRLEDWAGR